MVRCFGVPLWGSAAPSPVCSVCAAPGPLCSRRLLRPEGKPGAAWYLRCAGQLRGLLPSCLCLGREGSSGSPAAMARIRVVPASGSRRHLCQPQSEAAQGCWQQMKASDGIRASAKSDALSGAGSCGRQSQHPATETPVLVSSVALWQLSAVSGASRQHRDCFVRGQAADICCALPACLLTPACSRASWGFPSCCFSSSPHG